MAVVNTTYNFNQPNMNFGQALLYGAFGSLTGGMGMYGGYGMGMGGSLFSMMGMGMGGYGCGFGGYGIGGYSDSYAGMQLGNAIAGIALNSLTQAIGSGRGGSAKQNTKDQIDSILSKAKGYMDDLTIEGENYSFENGNFMNAKVEKRYEENIKRADSAIQSRLETINGLLNGEYAKEPVRKEDESSEEFSKRLSEWEREKAALKNEKEALLHPSETNKLEYPLVFDLLNAKEDYKIRFNEINDAIRALEPLYVDYSIIKDNEKSESIYKELNKADGNTLSRMKNTDEAKAQTALFEFRKAQKKWMKGECNDDVKNQLKAAYNNVIANKDSIQKSHQTILSSIESWLEQENLKKTINEE